ncbi:MAG: sigma-54-dependent transcriptional regulator [bacterium]
MFKILIVDDEESVGLGISRQLTREGYQTLWAKCGEDALEKLATDEVHLIFLDLIMPGISGIPLLKRIRQEYPDILVIILTAYGDVHIAVQAMKLGAFDYLIKSSDMEELRLTIEKAQEAKKLHREVKSLRAEIDRHYEARSFVGKSPQIQKVWNLIKKISTIDQFTILVTGESGTGKELVARTIHRESVRAGNAFIDISCSALPNSLAESELFGYEKGAFTDAKDKKLGLIELADGGTLFFDEIGNLNLIMQAKLLRFLEQRSFRRIGGVNDLSVNINVIAATNSELGEMVDRGKFRHDLYYRLNVFLIRIPPLRERKEDIPFLVHHFIEKFNQDFHKNIQGLNPDAREVIMEHDYPGNVRELKNIIERAMIMEEGDIITLETLDFLKNMKNDRPGHYHKTLRYNMIKEENEVKAKFKLKELEKRHIFKVLKETNGNKAQAAEILGIARSTLFKKIKEYKNLDPCV